jgi:TM2 domain-containing membrane protein YozV
MADRDDRKWRRGLFSALLTFVLSLIFSCLSEFFLGRVTALILALLLLFVIILIGVLFDMVGFAAAAAEIGHLNARAANKLLGARQAVNLVKNADQVAIFCNDVMGDICATVSGAIGVTIVFRLATGSPGLDTTLLTTLITALVAAFTVGGKALGKGIALNEATEIMFRIGQIIAWLERFNDRKPIHTKGKR